MTTDTELNGQPTSNHLHLFLYLKNVKTKIELGFVGNSLLFLVFLIIERNQL